MIFSNRNLNLFPARMDINMCVIKCGMMWLIRKNDWMNGEWNNASDLFPYRGGGSWGPSLWARGPSKGDGEGRGGLEWKGRAMMTSIRLLMSPSPAHQLSTFPTQSHAPPAIRLLQPKCDWLFVLCVIKSFHGNKCIGLLFYCVISPGMSNPL